MRSYRVHGHGGWQKLNLAEARLAEDLEEQAEQALLPRVEFGPTGEALAISDWGPMAGACVTCARDSNINCVALSSLGPVAGSLESDAADEPMTLAAGGRYYAEFSCVSGACACDCDVDECGCPGQR